MSKTRVLVLLGLFVFFLLPATASLVSADDSSGLAVLETRTEDCVIPETGPWPPCATGGNGGGNDNGDCVIPESGPWPDCATGGNGSGNGNGDCVIPESGPWPDCATGGNGGGNGNGDCVIPESGPWPDCATGGNGGGGGGGGNGNGDCVIPESGPWPDCATGGGGGSPAPAPAPAPAPNPEPAPEPEPAPNNPGNTNILENNTESLTGLTLNAASSHTMDVTVHYAVDNPDEFIPVLLAFDPVNCFDYCEEVTSGEQFFPIKGTYGLSPDDYPLPASGGLPVQLAMDNLYCAYNPVTEVIAVAVWNLYDAVFNEGDVVFEGIMYVEVHHEWCK